MSNIENNDLTGKVMKEIRSGKAKMRPRLYFVAGSIALGLGLAGLVLAAVFFTNLVVFHLRMANPFAFLAFGARGLKPFALTFPLLFLAIAGVCLGVGLKLVRRFEFSYKKGLAGVAIGLMALVIVLGLVLDKVRFNERVSQLRQLRPFYRERVAGDEWLVGKVVEIKTGEEEAVIETQQGEQVRVRWDEETNLPPGKAIQEGESIRAVGEFEGLDFEAEVIGRAGEGAGQRKRISR